MNCQDITRILDEQEVDQLLAEELSAVRAHLASCRDCARDWQVHAQLSRATLPVTPPELRALFPETRGGVPALYVRRRSRIILIVTIAAVAAAASMLAARFQEPQALGVDVDSQQVPSRDPQDSLDAPAEKSIDVPADDDEQIAITVAQVPEQDDADPNRLRILVVPPRHESTEAAARPAVEAFHASLLQALRRSTDVIVDVSRGAAPVEGKPANRVTVVSPRVTILSSGENVYHSGDGVSSWSEGAGFRGPQRWAVEVMLEPAIRREPSGTSIAAMQLSIDANGIPSGTSCGTRGAALTRGIARQPGSAPDFNTLRALCSSVDSLAARLIDALRPVDEPAGEMSQFIARLSTGGSPGFDGQMALSEMINRSRQGGIVLEAAAIKAITAYIGSLPAEQRASGWRQLRSLQNPALVAPLLESLQHDADEQVRLAALATLNVDYASDRRLRAALESVSRHDTSELVRMNAQRSLSGESQWQTYVVNTLANTRLSAKERLAPAQYAVLSASYPEGFEQLRSFLGSDESTRHLVEIFRELRAAPLVSEGEVISGAFGFRQLPQDEEIRTVVGLLGMTNPAAALDLQISILTEDAELPTTITSMALTALMGRRDEPRVASVLDDIAAGKSGRQLQSEYERNIAIAPRLPSRPPATGDLSR